MGTIITLSMTPASPIAWLPPVASGLLYANFFDSLATQGRNLAIGGATPTINGVPTQSAGYLSFSDATTNIDTGLPDNGEQTLIAAVRWPSGPAAASYCLGAWGQLSGNPALIGGSALGVNPTPSLVYNGLDTRNNASVKVSISTSIATASVASFALLALREGDAISQLNNLTAGTASPNNDNAYPRWLTTATLHVGAIGNSVATGGCDVAFAAIYNRALSDTELTSLYTPIKTKLALSGITV